MAAKYRNRRWANLTSFQCLLAVLLAAGSVRAADPPGRFVPSAVLADPLLTDAEEAASLPLPSHPGRISPAPSLGEPKAAQPGREKKKPVAFVTRQHDRPPTPAHPSRDLKPLAEIQRESEEEAMEEEEEEAEDEPPPGLLLRLPHSLRDGGITAEFIYTGETFTNARGGISNRGATNYRSNMDVVFQIFTDKMGWWQNGRFLVYGQSVQGQPLSATKVGDFQLFSNLDSTISDTARPQFTAVSEYWYEHLLLDNRLRVKIGKQDSNADFATCQLGGDFANSSMQMPPMIPLSTYPSQTLGMSTFFTINDRWEFDFALFDGAPASGPSGVRWGFDTLGEFGAMTMYQLRRKSQTGPEGQHPGTVQFGMWHHSDDWEEITAGPARTFNQNYGLYVNVDQMLWKETYGDDDEQGLGVFAQFAWAPGDRNAIQENYVAGLVYKGLLPGRDEDLTGVAFSNLILGRSTVETEGLPYNNETAYELFHKCIFSPYFSLQPDVQYIRHPGAQYRDSLLFGLRFELVL